MVSALTSNAYRINSSMRPKALLKGNTYTYDSYTSFLLISAIRQYIVTQNRVCKGLISPGKIVNKYHYYASRK